MKKRPALLLVALSLLIVVGRTHGEQDVSLVIDLKVPDGFSIERAAGPPLTERPIVGAFDDEGRLYVAESSGSNDPVQKQLELRPHRIARLEDVDGDGRFDRRIVFADHMMFPEGAMFFEGSLYVAAPPSIWKLTDTDGDGVADQRVEWFQGKTLTGCANDLHGPYAGPDGWIYWCKGAFEEQTHIVNGQEWKSKAAHIFRCRPDGTGLEPVITAGMDNPVDVAFMSDGEMFFSGTYFSGNPRRDGFAHAIYGGVYGKEQSALAGHPRTGELMPVMVPMTAAACSGLERYDSDIFGSEYRDNLFLCQFNLRKVSRHVLRPSGSTFTSENSDFVTSDFVDFHPTDVLVDADGSLLVIDTGGWYKLCCPTSQLWKPDVLGGIYRVRRVGVTPPVDPRGLKIDWPNQSLEELWRHHADGRQAVRLRASREFIRRRDEPGMSDFLDSRRSEVLARASSNAPDSEASSLALIWSLSQFGMPQARALIRDFHSSERERIRHVVLQAISRQRDPHIFDQELIIDALDDPSPANRRLLAEGIGRLGFRWSAPNLLAAADDASDRVLQHSIIYALIELADIDATRKGLADKSPRTIAVALIALDQIPGNHLQASDVIPHLGATDATLRDAATWVVLRHPEWGQNVALWLEPQLTSLAQDRQGEVNSLENMLVTFSSDAAVQRLIAEVVLNRDSSPTTRAAALRIMAKAKLPTAPAPWIEAIRTSIAENDALVLPAAIDATRELPPAALAHSGLADAVTGVANSQALPADLRVTALAVVAAELNPLSDANFDLLNRSLMPEVSVPQRLAAAIATSRSHLTSAQLERLCETIQAVGPLELNQLLPPFEHSTEEQVGLKLIASLKKSSALPSLRLDLLRATFTKYGPAVQKAIAELEPLVNVDVVAQRKRIEDMLPLVERGDVRRGHAVYYSSKAACSSCHRLGYAGGTTGPELTHIGATRTERDILESILYPSLSFVRSYEPMLILTEDGKTTNGVIVDETENEFIVATGPDEQTRVNRSSVEQLVPSTVSIMPAGLDKQMTPQELADLVVFLKSATSTK